MMKLFGDKRLSVELCPLNKESRCMVGAGSRHCLNFIPFRDGLIIGIFLAANPPVDNLRYKLSTGRLSRVILIYFCSHASFSNAAPAASKKRRFRPLPRQSGE